MHPPAVGESAEQDAAAVLTEDERESLTVALYESKIGVYGYLGRPECEQFTEPLVPAVERILSDRLATARADAEAGWSRLATRIGFGDGVTEPQATPDEATDAIEQAFSDARDHAECPRLCERCGEWLADTVCTHCGGGGCGPGTASGAYDECEWCAGVGKVHPGCADLSYADLSTRRADAEARAERAESALRAVVALADEWGKCGCAPGDCDYYECSILLRAALAARDGAQ